MVAPLPGNYELLEIKNPEGLFTVCSYGIEFFITPAKAGIHSLERTWIPASAGMTDRAS